MDYKRRLVIIMVLSIVGAGQDVHDPYTKYRAVLDSKGKNLCALGRPMEVRLSRGRISCARICLSLKGCLVFNVYDNGTCEVFDCYIGFVNQFSIIAKCAAMTDIAVWLGNYILLEGSGLILYQRRVDHSNIFDQSWNAYKDGFGIKCGNFWLGNENVYQITTNKTCSLRMVMRSAQNGAMYVADFSSFYLESEAKGYKIHTSGFTGNASFNAMSPHESYPFSAYRDSKCSLKYGSGWWFTVNRSWPNCYESSFTSSYPQYHYLPPGANLNYTEMWINCK